MIVPADITVICILILLHFFPILKNFCCYFYYDFLYYFSFVCIHTLLKSTSWIALSAEIHICVNITSKGAIVTKGGAIDTLISNRSWLYEGFKNGSASMNHPLYLQMKKDKMLNQAFSFPLEVYCQGFGPAEIMAGWCFQTPPLNQKIMLWGNQFNRYSVFQSICLSLIAEVHVIDMNVSWHCKIKVA